MELSEGYSKMNLPALFPCASKVKVPQMGSEGLVDQTRPKSLPPFLHRPKSKTGPVSRQYVKKISADMVFSEDVVKARCFHMLPYDDKYFYDALQLGDLIKMAPKNRIPAGRHNNRNPDKKHIPCQFKKLSDKKMTNMKETCSSTKLGSTDDSEGSVKDYRSTLSNVDELSSSSPFFMTESNGEMIPTQKPDNVPQHEWDAYLMSILSSTTAYWIVHKRMSPSERQTGLNSLLKTWYGEPEHTDLIREDTSEKDFDSKPENSPKKQWKKSEANLLDRVYGEFGAEVKLTSTESAEEMAEAPPPTHKLSLTDLHPTLSESIDPYSEDNKAPFYRQPAGFRRQIKHQEKQIAAGINSTARDIDVRSYTAPVPLTLKDVMKPGIDNTIYHTDNLFQQEWLTGVNQVSDLDGDKSKIVMTSNNMYEKQLQTYYPRPPESWCPDKSTRPVRQSPVKVRRTERGMQKWRNLPKPIDDTANVLSIISPDYDHELRGSPDPIARRNTKQNSSMMKILEEWRTQWHLAGQYADSTPDDLIHDMADIQPHVRLKAVATVSKAITYKAPSDPGIQIHSDKNKVKPVDQLPEKIFRALEYLLNDKHDQVKRAAAIALYSMDRPTPEAESLMREAIKGENSVDRWAAAQCLAHYGICDATVVGEIIKQLLSTEDSVKHERAISLLSKISADSMLVHSMVAEHLNSSSWRHKVIACKVFPTLQTRINKDITQKLADLMWNDWHKEVRSAAAQALGKTGQGKIVHDGLREKILVGSERTRVEAIYRIGQLGIMTARLLPSYLKCFDDSYVSVRCEACSTAAMIYIQDEAVLKKLLFCATYDPVWKVKAVAVQTLGKIGLASAEIKSCLLWAMRYEDQEAVRAEACHSLIALGQEALDCDELIDAFQERLLVETSDLVKQQISEALQVVGINATDDVDMVADIKNAVRKLCTRDNIASQISINEAAEERDHNKARMIQSKAQEAPTTPQDDGNRSQVTSREEVLRRMRKRIQSPLVRPKEVNKDPDPSNINTPDLSRESTMGTPQLDKELQDVLDRENSSLSRSSSPSTPINKSRTTHDTAGSPSSGQHRIGETETEITGETSGSPPLGQGIEKAGMIGEPIIDDTEKGVEAEITSKTVAVADQAIEAKGLEQTNDIIDKAVVDLEDVSESREDSADNKPSTVTADGCPKPATVDEELLETVELHAGHHVQIEVPVNGEDDTPISVEQFKMKPKKEKDVFKGIQARSSSRRKLMNQQLAVEKTKVQLEAVKSFNNLDSRYSTMTGHLQNIDDAFQPVTAPNLTPPNNVPSQSSTLSSSSGEEVLIDIPVLQVTEVSEITQAGDNQETEGGIEFSVHIENTETCLNEDNGEKEIEKTTSDVVVGESTINTNPSGNSDIPLIKVDSLSENTEEVFQ